MSDDLNERLLKTLDAINSIDNGTRAVTTGTLGDSDEDPMEAFSSEIPNVEVKDLDSEEKNEEETDLLKDYKRARNYTYAMQDISLVMLKNLTQIAATTMHPKAYDSVKQMLDTMRGMNKDLMDFQKLLLESRSKKRTLPLKTPLEEGESRLHSVTDENGTTLTISTKDRPTTTNILEAIRKAKERGEDLSKLDNQMIVAEAELLEQDEIEVIDDGGQAEFEGRDGSAEDGVQGS